MSSGRKYMRALFFIVAVLSIACSDASAQAYRWVDQEGRVHYTQTPPPPDAKNVQRKKIGGGGNEGAELAKLPYATQVTAKNFPVTLRTSPDCGAPCDQARAALVRRGIPFKEISVVGQNDIDELKKISWKDQVPHLIVGSQMQSGFRDDLYGSLLDTAGYPPSGPQLPLDALRKMAAPSEPPKVRTQQGVGDGAPQEAGRHK